MSTETKQEEAPRWFKVGNFYVHCTAVSQKGSTVHVCRCPRELHNAKLHAAWKDRLVAIQRHTDELATTGHEAEAYGYRRSMMYLSQPDYLAECAGPRSNDVTGRLGARWPFRSTLKVFKQAIALAEALTEREMQLTLRREMENDVVTALVKAASSMQPSRTGNGE